MKFVDDKSVEKMKDVINFQFDLELLMKRQEIHIIQEKMKQADDILKEIESNKHTTPRGIHPHFLVLALLCNLAS